MGLTNDELAQAIEVADKKVATRGAEAMRKTVSYTSAGMRVDHIDDRGNSFLRIHLWQEPDECNMCGALGYHHYAVPWYCGPVATGENEGGYKAVCERCYGRWEAWDNSLRYSGA